MKWDAGIGIFYDNARQVAQTMTDGRFAANWKGDREGSAKALLTKSRVHGSSSGWHHVDRDQQLPTSCFDAYDIEWPISCQMLTKDAPGESL